MSGTESVLMPFMVALGIGLWAGARAEKRRSTFAVASLFGAVSIRIGVSRV